MKNSAAKTVILIVYIVLLTKIMDFRLSLILNVPYLVMVLGGSCILSLLSYRKGTGKAAFLGKFKIMALVAGGLTAFFANIAFAAGTDGGTAEMYITIVRNFLPLFYGFLIYFIADLIRLTASAQNDAGHAVEDSGVERLEDYDLTRREIAVAKEILAGMSNCEIAGKLSVSENTVKKHVNHLFQKVGVRNRTELIHKFTPADRFHTLY